jgi:hypothetical protein
MFHVVYLTVNYQLAICFAAEISEHCESGWDGLCGDQRKATGKPPETHRKLADGTGSHRGRQKADGNVAESTGQGGLLGNQADR